MRSMTEGRLAHVPRTPPALRATSPKGEDEGLNTQLPPDTIHPAGTLARSDCNLALPAAHDAHRCLGAQSRFVVCVLSLSRE